MIEHCTLKQRFEIRRITAENIGNPIWVDDKPRMAGFDDWDGFFGEFDLDDFIVFRPFGWVSYDNDDYYGYFEEIMVGDVIVKNNGLVSHETRTLSHCGKSFDLENPTFFIFRKDDFNRLYTTHGE